MTSSPEKYSNHLTKQALKRAKYLYKSSKGDQVRERGCHELQKNDSVSRFSLFRESAELISVLFLSFCFYRTSTILYDGFNLN